MNECTIEWNALSLNEWDDLFRTIRRSTLLQSYPYAQALCACQHQRARWGLIRIGGAPAGLVQVTEAGALGLHGVIVDRGPLWLPGYGQARHWVPFFAAFDRAFPRRLGRRRRIIPEIDQTQAILVPYVAVPRIKPYQTIWMDLRVDEDDLRAGLNRNWRNHLNRAERENVRVEWHKDGTALPWLMRHHSAHRTVKNFQAASPAFIRALAKYSIPRGDMLLGQAFAGDESVAGVLFFRHGASATYQVGWSGEQGRKVNAHQLLLWQGMMRLKQEGIQDLDLGGINDIAEGVKTFKEGMGGETVALAGMYR
ncbi:MAG: GNAT family N-acetyltransferase [Micavibrio aeruginosavorus]|uniref:GNAT family N-acetyltransferase n=1 Tax=Micavibrio aeruginosavorus TaxID=349221 RepID=A0A7T5R1V1_9BACT|nr:MAG: GNAT family N-acetyltransferase [Micavibrio aeruginosavorus]